MTFADTADGGIARHLADSLDALGQQQRTRSHARGSQCSFGAGMTTTDDDDVEIFRKLHGVILRRGAKYTTAC